MEAVRGCTNFTLTAGQQAIGELLTIADERLGDPDRASGVLWSIQPTGA
jgi:hypothetical protein